MRSRHLLAFPAILAGIALLFLGACSDEADTGRVHLTLTDAPYPVDMIERAEITVTAINVHIQGDEEDEGWHPVPFETTTFDLLELQNGITAFLGETEVPVGDLDEIRLVISSGEIELTDTRIFPLSVPSGSSSGLKLKVRPPIAVEGDLTSEVLLDMDVSRSFLPNPASPTKVEDIVEFKFHPVVRVANLGTTGSVAGFVLSTEGTEDTADDTPIDMATVLVHSEGDSSTVFTNADGYYKVMGLADRVWQIEAEATGFTPAVTAAQIVAGNDVEVDPLRLEPLAEQQ